MQPTTDLSLSLHGHYVGNIAFDLIRANRYEDVVGEDGAFYSSKSPAAYDIAHFEANARVAYGLTQQCSVRLTVSNITGKSYHIPGATTVPSRAASRQWLLGLAVEH